MKELKVVPGSFSGFFSNVSIMKSKSTLEAKSKSRRLPTDRKGFADANEAQERLTYCCGKF